MKAWRVCGREIGEVIYADTEAEAIDQYKWTHGAEPDEVARAQNLDGEPRTQFSNAELQAAGFAVPCDFCIEHGGFDWRYDEPSGETLAVIDGQTICSECMTPRQHLANGGDPEQWTYAEQWMDMPYGGLPLEAKPLAKLETS